MAFTPIDESTWERREYLEVFRQTAIYLTADISVRRPGAKSCIRPWCGAWPPC